MKSLQTILIAIICCCIFACGKKKASVEDASVDSLLNQQMADAGPNEDEISMLTDTAKQEEPEVKKEKDKCLRIYVSKTTMQLYVVDKNDSVLFSCGIACGLRRGNKTEKGDYKTPEGDFHISGMFDSTDWIHHTRDGRDVKGCYGPHFLRLATGRLGGIGIHGTNAPGSIGKRASEGCIRVNSANIITLFNEYAYNGMPVTVSTENAPLPLFKGLKKPLKSKEKEKEEELPLEKDAVHQENKAESKSEIPVDETHEVHESETHYEAADTLFD